MDVEIESLRGHSHLAVPLAEWHVAEFGHLYEPSVWSLEIATEEFQAMAGEVSDDETWVAFAGAGRDISDVLGSVSLVASDDLPGFEHLTPWLASLYVVRSGRGSGVGTALVDRCVTAAGQADHREIYLFTAGQAAYYADRGWRVVAELDRSGHAATVMAKSTSPRGARRTVASHWCSNPDTNGAYSYLRVGGTRQHRERLAGTILPGLWLAGEATWAEHPATLHGAWFSGERAAKQVIEAGGGDVIVIGAGLAGIAAARTLTASGRQVTVLESTDHLGGRATTDTSLGIPLPLGGAWLHGPVGHPLQPYVSTIPEDWGFGVTFVHGHGTLDDDGRRQVIAVRAELDQLLESYPSDMTADVAIDAALAELEPLAPEVRTAVAEWISVEIENLYAAPLADFAPSAGYESYELPGNDQIITSSLEPVIEQLAQGLEVRFDTPVRSLRHDGDRWHTDVDVTAAHVVVTAPVGALRAQRITFDPALPDDVVDALAHLGVGPVTKLFATYDSHWWPADVRPLRFAGGFALRQAADMTALTGAACLCWFATGDWARQIETMSEHQRCQLVDEVARSSGLLDWDR